MNARTSLIRWSVEGVVPSAPGAVRLALEEQAREWNLRSRHAARETAGGAWEFLRTGTGGVVQRLVEVHRSAPQHHDQPPPHTARVHISGMVTGPGLPARLWPDGFAAVQRWRTRGFLRALAGEARRISGSGPSGGGPARRVSDEDCFLAESARRGLVPVPLRRDGLSR